MAKIVIDPGHGGYDSGASGFGIKEKDIALDIAKKTARYLYSYNCQTKLTRTTDIFVTLSGRSKIANDWGANLFVSIHCNAGGGIGYESFVSRFASANSKKIQNAIHPLSVKLFTKDRGKKRALFSVLVRTRMPAILTENGFIDNAHDAGELKSAAFRQQIAESIGKGIVQYFNLKKKAQPPKEVSELAKAKEWAEKNKIVLNTRERNAKLSDLIVVAYRLYNLLKK